MTGTKKCANFGGKWDRPPLSEDSELNGLSSGGGGVQQGEMSRVPPRQWP